MNCATCGHGKNNHMFGSWPHYRTPCDLCTHCHSTKPLGKDCCTSPSRCRCDQFVQPEPVDRYSTDTIAGAIGEVG